MIKNSNLINIETKKYIYILNIIKMKLYTIKKFINTLISEFSLNKY